MPFSLYDLCALGAALCFAITGVLAAQPARHLGAFAFTRLRMFMVMCMLAPVVALLGGWQSLNTTAVAVLALSGFVGIFIGDTALFATMNRLGPRRAGVLFATNSLFSALLGFWWLDERMGAQALAGATLVVGGVMLAIVWGSRKDESHALEASRGRWQTGVALGLLAAVCQSLGTLIAKPVMAAGTDPLAATLVRVCAGTAAQFALYYGGFAAARASQAATPRLLVQVALIGVLGMGVGMSLVLLALQRGSVGLVAVLSSVSPVLILPILWWRMGRAPARGAWAGAAVTVVGTALVLLR